jgi:Ca2+-binding RTX toxin-like protein
VNSDFERAFGQTGRRAVTGLTAAIIAIAAALLMAPSASAAPDSEGQEFWLAFPGNFQGTTEQTLFITGPEATSGTVEAPGLSFSQPFTVTPGTVTSVELPDNSDLKVEEGTEEKGIHVTADREVSVYGLNFQTFTTDAYLGLPVDVLGTSNIVLGIGTGCCRASQLGVAASQDATTVTITPTVDGAGGRTAGVPYDVMLDRGDAYQLRAATEQEDLSGTIVNADKPISVYGGHQCANIPNMSFVACDHVVEQMPNTDTWGRSFGTVPLKTRSEGDTFRVVASQDGTEVSVNGSPVATLNRGGVHQQLIDGRSTITANNPILVGQYSNSSSFDGANADPFEMLIPPLEQFLARYTVTTPATGFQNNFINLVVPDSQVGNVAVDGTAVPGSEFAPIGSSGFSGAQVDVSVGAHRLSDTQPFGAFQYGFANFDSYGYAGGQSFSPIARVVSIAVDPPSATHPVRTEQCVTATPRDQNGAAVPDVRLDFVVTGANTASGFQTADASGQTRFCYTGNNVGEDTITASLGQLRGTATKTWVERSPDCPFELNGRIAQGDDTNETIVGTPNNDLLRGGGGDDNIDGIPGDDCLFGDAGNDQLTGADGTDQIFAGAGADKATGDAGNDDIDGGTDADDLNGNAGNDRAIGRGANDRVKGGPGKDRVQGSGGKDRVNGDGGKDTVRGGTHGDRVFGGPGNDKVQSQGGNDRVDGGDGRDNIRAGGGNDKVNSADGFPDTVKCGLGFDKATVDDKDKVNDDCNRVTVKQGNK